MNILGIIAEYNPFHNGHKYHISKSAEELNADGVIAVMSGSFVQRGEPAILPKHLRAEFAVKNGADLVIELPSVFSSASAEYFALGGISALNATGIVSHISFGCEDTDLTLLSDIALELTNESQAFSSALKNEMSYGSSFPRARIKALEHIFQKPLTFLSKPNNILAVEYLKALYSSKSSIQPFPVARVGSDYSSDVLRDERPSATAVRNFIYSSPENLDNLQEFIPLNIIDDLILAVNSGLIPDHGKFDIHILSLLRHCSPEALRSLPYVAEGLEHRLIKAAQNSFTLEEFFKKCSSSRYPLSRIRRITAALLTGISADLLNQAQVCGIPYLRVLAFNERGAELLHCMKECASIPVIAKPSLINNLSDYAKQVAKTESRATDIFNLSLRSPIAYGMDFKNSPIRVF